MSNKATTPSDPPTKPSSPSSPPPVKFVPFSSTAESSLWLSYSKLKLDVIKLSEDPVPFRGSYGIVPPSTRAVAAAGAGAAGGGGVGGRMRFDQGSLDGAASIHGTDEKPSALPGGTGSGASAASEARNELVHTTGTILALNTIESFKKLDKNRWLNEQFIPRMMRLCNIKVDEDASMMDESNSEVEDEEEEDMSILTSVLCLTHLDLKNHTVLYWFAFPCLAPAPGKSIRYATDQGGEGGGQQILLNKSWSQEQCQSLHVAYHTLRVKELQAGGSTGGGCPPYFLIVPQTEKKGGGGMGQQQGVQCWKLSYRNYMRLTSEQRLVVLFGFLDPSSHQLQQKQQESRAPVGWTLRNLLAYLTLKFDLGGKDVEVVSYRPKLLRRITDTSSSSSPNPNDGGDESFLLRIALPQPDDYIWPPPKDGSSTATTQSGQYKAMGWELNARSKPGPRHVNLTPLIDPAHLATQASDLNLKLMKWRMIPSLDLYKLQTLKVVLLGAGTLGCAVARTLLGWGVRHMTLVDNGKVSYSNPVRQNLFELNDCTEGGGKYKSVAALEALKRIASDMKGSAEILSIPMPGHAFSEEKESENVRQTVNKLDELIQNADAVFLLTDTRESRWLPTVMCAAHDTLLINAALGLDSWLVIRHGLSSPSRASSDKSSQLPHTNKKKLGCYFCNDIVAPENSTQNRTLDQQCTVTRPGLSPIAASMATEVLIALLHHPLGGRAPAPAQPTTTGGNTATFSPTAPTSSSSEYNTSSPLGVMPHQIRGSVVSYTMMTPTVPAFDCCTGCSDAIIDAYHRDKFDLVKNACNCVDGPKYLEDMTGLTAFREEATKRMEEMDVVGVDMEDEDGRMDDW